MKEEFLHYIWKTQALFPANLKTEDGQSLEIVFPGEHNHDSGPDFFNAKIKIDGMLWSGNVEIHIRASDWMKHGHQNDEAYNNVILHVVLESDVPVKSHAGEYLPTLILGDFIDKSVYQQYAQLQDSKEEIGCAQRIREVPSIMITNWLSRLVAERLERRISEMMIELEQNGNDWEETFYRHLARQMGMKINAEPFQWLATQLPFKILARQRDNLLQTEALLFGQSGLTPEWAEDAYSQSLIREYAHLKLKYTLQPMPAHQWKFMRMRPNNFPTLRIAQLAALIFRHPQLFRTCMETSEISELKAVLNVSASDYWKEHYRFGQLSKPSNKPLGAQAIDTILINTIAPFKFLYGRMRGDEQLEQEAISMLEAIDSESNKIMREWLGVGIKATSSAESQALLELKKNYCQRRNCLSCHIGNYLLTENLEGNRIIRNR